jgi:hypothetical protein
MAFVVHRICEEFGVLPAVAARALEADTGLMGEVLDVRAFVAAWHARAVYEAQEPRPARGPSIPKTLADRLTTARVARLMALKGPGAI